MVKSIKKLKKLNESGLVSIIVTMVLIIVMTLVVLAMSRNATREQRQSLDRQLSDQAFYNAESGIGDWANYLYAKISDPTVPIEKLKCDDTEMTSAPSPRPIPDIDANNKYTCVLYNKAPTEVEFGGLKVDDSKTIPIRSDVAIQEIQLRWRPANNQALIATGCNNTTAGPMPVSQSTVTPSNCNVGALRVDVINPGNGSPGSPTTRDAIRNNNFVGFFLPFNGPASNVLLNSGRSVEQGVVGLGACSGGWCTVRLTGVALNANETLYLHLRNLYSPDDVQISAYSVAGSTTPVRLFGAQYIIDVTGKSADVLRRVKARLPATPQIDNIDYTLRTADSICKLISVNKDAGTAQLESGPAGSNCSSP